MFNKVLDKMIADLEKIGCTHFITIGIKLNDDKNDATLALGSNVLDLQTITDVLRTMYSKMYQTCDNKVNIDLIDKLKKSGLN